MTEIVDIDLSNDDPITFILADENGPVDFSGTSEFHCFITGPKPSTMRVEWPCSVSGVGRVVIPKGGIHDGWEGFEFVATWGPGETKTFPDTGPRWLLAR